MSLPADLPFAALRYTADTIGGGNARCEVILDGEPVALLACTSVEFVNQHYGGYPHVKIGVVGHNVDVSTIPPVRSA